MTRDAPCTACGGVLVWVDGGLVCARPTCREGEVPAHPGSPAPVDGA
jgi:hypothetical protein